MMSKLSITMAVVNTTNDDSDRDWSAFRFGQPYSYENARFVVDRDPYARIVARDLEEEALGAGFDAVDPKTEEVLSWSDDMWKELKPHWEQFIYAAELQNTFEWSILVTLANDNPTLKGIPFLKAFEPADVDQSRTAFYRDGSLKSTRVHLWNKDALDHWFEIGVNDGFQSREPANIDNAFYTRYSYKRKFWKGRSEIENIWDIIWGLRAIHMGCTIFAIRKAAGLRIVVLPPGMNASSEEVSDMRTASKKMDAFDAFFIIPPGADVKVDASGQADYSSLKDTLLSALSAKTGIPLAKFNGIEMERQGGDFNQELMFDAWRYKQRIRTPMTEWVTNRFNLFFSWYDEGTDWKPMFRMRVEVSDKEKSEILSTNVTSYSEAISANLISIANAQKELGFPVEEVENPIPEIGNIRLGMDEEEPIAEEIQS